MTITLIIIAITCVVSVVCFKNIRWMQALIFWPPAITRQFQLHRFVTHGFIHADGQHLLFNMITLFFFGRAIEGFYTAYLGPMGYALFYLLGIIVAILPSYLQHRNDANYRSLGASGAVSAVLFSFILFRPWSTIYVFFLPVPAILYAVLYMAYTVYSSGRSRDNINHSAHLWGAVYGIIFTAAMEPRVINIFLSNLLQPSLGL
ncbi:rhomboid family intramembrane serine protease [Phytohalomonas tamaricis]|uniref:rhomboid family intramembrane serine protease n=1 Tax=Phytohalomonas tamaricis TaxID=2081032 RepID=UPI000D0B70EC|nr:rhomboid family intramembrane serine protease [Phytohalomonas tamaricis]